MKLTSNQIIELLETREKLVFAMFSHYLKKGADEDSLQRYIDEQCQKHAKYFVEEFYDSLKDDIVRDHVLQYLINTRYGQKYNGKRLMPEVFSLLCDFKDLTFDEEKEIEDN